MIPLLALTIILFLAYANGANDNFKGVATLLGSGVASFRNARLWATFTTGLGALAAVILAQELLAKFSGKGLVPNDVVALKSFCLSVALAAALTVMLATKVGFPVSTTHAITGALVGAGWFASPRGVDLKYLGGSFFIPLLLSPILSLTACCLVYLLFKKISERSSVTRQTCVCIGEKVVGVVPAGMSPGDAIASFQTLSVPELAVGTEARCVQTYGGDVMGIPAGRALDALHYLSAGAVGFARGLNDAPKITALLVATSAFDPAWGIAAVAIAMAVGGWVNGAKVAEIMSKKVTSMNPGQGFSANLVTAAVVIGASRFGMPVSTTHVSCGALFGIGMVNGTGQIKTILSILTAWITTLPVAGLLGLMCFAMLSRWL